jgi:hypothetical protein
VILIERPPNFEQILKAFPNAGNPGVIFAYGDYIYNPGGGVIPEALIQHEAVHQRRQGADPQRWWELYIEVPSFRYAEELAAHVAEYKAQLHGIDRNQKHKLLMATAARLVAPLYNYQPRRSLAAAMRDIRWELER